MHLKRTAGFAAGCAALAAWLAGAATSGTRTVPIPPDRPVAPDASLEELSAQAARLHERLAPAAEPVRPGRDLFRFKEPRLKPPPVAAPRAAALTEAPALAAVAAPPPLKLDGIAEDGAGDDIVRTAIISTGAQLFLAREGDAVTPRFAVTRIAPDVVELLDRETNTTIRLALR